MAEIEMPHPDHEKHLCLLKNIGYIKARCKTRRMKFRATTFFRNAAPATDGFSFGCKPKGR